MRAYTEILSKNAIAVGNGGLYDESSGKSGQDRDNKHHKNTFKIQR
jgi:hypothetical protein